LPKTKSAYVIASHLMRCGTSVGANYMAIWRRLWENKRQIL